MTVNVIQFGFIPEKRTINAVFTLRSLQKEYHGKGKKLCMCFVDLAKVFDSVSRKDLEG